MGKISRDTFQLNQAKQYVGVRLQSSVPIVDADWNELEDIRKHEHQTFLQAFVGNGVQPGSENFQIQALTLILTAAVNLEIDLVKSTAAAALGFDATNQQATAKDNVPAQLISHHAEPFTLSSGMTLVVKVNGVEQTITFNFPDDAQDQAKLLTTAEVITAINNTVPQLATTNDFRILGGTPQQPGLCLVEGWEIQIPASLNYTEQLLYNNAELATQWQVTPLFPLTTPTAARSDIIYLDAWERLVDSTEDPDLINDLIGVETCLRRKREWVVRVAEGSESLPESPLGHVYYPLARLTRPANQAVISAEQLTDLRQELALARQSEVQQVAQDVQQVVRDAFNYDYTLAQDGQPHLKVSLREAINALLRGTIPTTPVTILTTATFDPPTASYWISAATSFTDSQKMSWVFWGTSGYDPNKQVNKASMWYKRYDPNTQKWEKDQELSTVEKAFGNYNLQLLEDQQGNIWLFWYSYRNDHAHIYYQRYVRAKQQWEGEQPLTDDKTDNYYPVAIKDSAGNIWVFWSSYRQTRDGQGNYDIYYRRYLPATNTWEAEQQLTNATETDNYPTATVDSQGNIYVFWQSQRLSGEVWNGDIYYKTYYVTDTRTVSLSQSSRAASLPSPLPSPQPHWSNESRLTSDDAYDQQPFAFTTSRGEIWVFWLSDRTGNTDIWYRRNIWGNEIQLNTGTGSAWNLRIIEDSRGDIWVFWYGDNSQVFYKHYSGAWGLTTQLTTDWSNYFSVTENHAGDIWTFWARDHEIQHRQLITVI